MPTKNDTLADAHRDMAAASSALGEGDLALATHYAASARNTLTKLTQDATAATSLLAHLEAELVRQSERPTVAS